MFKIDTIDDTQLILPKKNTVSRFQQGNNFLNSGSERKRSLHIKKNISESKVVRKLDFGNDQDTLTALPDITSLVAPSYSDQTPTLLDLANDFKNHGYLDNENNNRNISGLNFSGSRPALKSSFKNKKSSISQIEDDSHFSNGSPLRPINANTMNYQNGGISQIKMTKFFQNPEPNNSSNSIIPNLPPKSNRRENNNERRQGLGNESGVKIIRPPPQNYQNFDANSTKTIDLTENDTYFKNLIQKEKLLNFSDIDKEMGNESSFINNSNNSLTTLPPKNKKARKPLAPKVYDDEPSKNKNDTSGAFASNLFTNVPNDDDTNTNNLNSIILPKKSVTFGGKKNNNNANNIYDTNNSIDTMFIAQTISKQPMLANLNPDETNTNMNMSLNGSMNMGNGRKNNVRFINNSNRKNEFKENEVFNFNQENNEEDNDITKADIDPEFESEHSAILPPTEDHTIKFSNRNNNNNNNYSTSANNFIFPENSNHSGILKNKNNSRSKLEGSLIQGSGSFIGNNNNNNNYNSRLGNDFGINVVSDTSYIIGHVNGLFSHQIKALSKDMSLKANNQLQRTNSIMSRFNNTSFGNNPNILSIINEHKEEVSRLSFLYSLSAENEILCNLAMLHENRQLISRQMMHSMKTLKATISMAIEEINRPKSTMQDVQFAIARLEETKNRNNNQIKNGGSVFTQKYNLLKQAIPFKVSSLSSIPNFSVFNQNPNSVLVKCTYRAVEKREQLMNAESLHVKVSKFQRNRKLKNEMAYLMSVVPGFFCDGSKFSCLISSLDKKIRFAIVLDIPSFYPWCYLTVNTIRVDFGTTFEDVKEKIDEYLSSAKITPHPISDLVQALINEYK